MTPTQSRMKEIAERCEKATPQTKRTFADRVGFEDGSFAYEIQDDDHLVTFYEDNHEQPMKAKFNAELYAHARTDIPFLLEQLTKAVEVIEKIADPRKRDHKEPDAYTQLGCVMSMADDFLKEMRSDE